MKRILPLVLLSIVLASCLGQVMGEYVRVGQSIPSFSVELSDGRSVSNKTLRGRPCVIVFFNTACGDCRRELVEVQQVYEELRDRATFLCIGRKEEATTVEAYWKNQRLSIPYSAQKDRQVFDLFASTGIPRVYVADGNGIVHHIFVEKVRARRLRNAILSL